MTDPLSIQGTCRSWRGSRREGNGCELSLQQSLLIEDSSCFGPVPWMCRHQLSSRRSPLRAPGWDAVLDVISCCPHTSFCIKSAQEFLLFVLLTDVLSIWWACWHPGLFPKPGVTWFKPSDNIKKVRCWASKFPTEHYPLALGRLHICKFLLQFMVTELPVCLPLSLRQMPRLCVPEALGGVNSFC